MQLVVELPDEYYKALLSSSHVYLTMGGRGNGKTLVSTVLVAVANGTPLPKGHGRLIDADALASEYSEISLPEYIIEPYINAPTIIEADKEGAE